VQELSALFPNSEWVLGQAAVAQYNLRNFDVAQSLFEELRLRDPFRTEVRVCPALLNSVALGVLCAKTCDLQVLWYRM
jgi:hypothetical protein